MCEKELLLAMISRAYDDARGLTTFKCNREKVIANAWDWIFSDSNSSCSFLWICDRLNLPCRRIREKIKEEYLMKKMNPFGMPKPMMKQRGTPLSSFTPPAMPKSQGMPMPPKRRKRAPKSMPMSDEMM
jgi:hypothetical protein